MYAATHREKKNKNVEELLGLILILLITTIVVFNLFLITAMGNEVSKHQHLQIFVLKLNKYE